MEHHYLTEVEIEQAVTQFIELLRLPFNQSKPGEDPKPLIALMLRAFEDPEGVKRDLIAYLRTQDPAKIRVDVSFDGDGTVTTEICC